MLTSTETDYFLIDMPHTEMIEKSDYHSQLQHSADRRVRGGQVEKGTLQYHFDKTFCSLLNRYGITSKQAALSTSQAVSTYNATIYGLREAYFAH